MGVNSKNKEEKTMVQEFKAFMNDSQMFLQKCAKPNQKGKLLATHTPRVHEDGPVLRPRHAHHRLRRLLHQARLHSNQQYHLLRTCVINTVP